MLGKIQKKRMLFSLVIIFVIFSLFLSNLFQIQIVEALQTQNSVSSVVTQEISAERGEILDRNGVKLVVNEQVNTIVFEYLEFPTSYSERNEIIYALIQLFEAYDCEYIDKLPIIYDDSGNLVFDESRSSEVSYLKSSAFLDLNYYATVDNCFDALVSMYGLSDYSEEDARKIASVYYSMMKNGFNSSTPYTFASDVSSEMVSIIKEQQDIFTGVDVQVVSDREYVYTELAPHILGTIGPVTSEEYEYLADEGYALTDYVGKSGIEYAYEDYLRGEDGELTITVDSEGNVTEEVTIEPVSGNTVVLTLDMGLQLVAQEALEEVADEIQQNVSFDISGAVVVMDVSSNEILACASYPTYTYDEYENNYDELAADESNPLWNRALRSTFTPGSTIKPIVAIAGLEEGVINLSTTISCYGVYTYYEDYQPTCTSTHGALNVVYALFNSCNIFFYETSRLLGIDTLNDYFTMFGLGESTGVELTESVGTVDSVELRESLGEIWTPGLTIQAGIGYGNNQFTPLQLCSYVSTIANKGVRYEATFVKSILTYDYSSTVYEHTPTILSNAEFSDSSWDAVYEAMVMIGSDGSVDYSSISVEIAAKTGTTTVDKTIDGEVVETNNGLIICFAPYDDPEIAIVVTIEGATWGSSVAGVAVAILEYYFNTEETSESVQTEGTLLQ